MVRTVFILGAGASRMAHGPLISDFVEKCDQVMLAGEAGWAREHFNRERRARMRLQAAYAKGNINIDNVEDLFDVYETASLLRRLSDVDPREVEGLPRDLRFVIMRTLERSITYPMVTPTEHVRAPVPYTAFVELIHQIQRSRSLDEVAVISFNYDLCLDYASAVACVSVDYGLGAVSPAHKSQLAVLKLHGSHNWSADSAAKCLKGSSILPRTSQSDTSLWSALQFGAVAASATSC